MTCEDEDDDVYYLLSEVEALIAQRQSAILNGTFPPPDRIVNGEPVWDDMDAAMRQWLVILDRQARGTHH